MKNPSLVRHRSQIQKSEPIELEATVEHIEQSLVPESELVQQELDDLNELDFAVKQTLVASAVLIYSKGFDASVSDEIREEIKNGDGSTFFFDGENETFPDSFSEDYVDFLLSYE